MSGANYEWCPVCGTKAFYVGDEDTDIVMIHPGCWDNIRAILADNLPRTLVTIQMSWGGLFDGKPTGQIHLGPALATGGVGDNICGNSRHQRDADGKPTGPGFSVGGGIDGPDVTHEPCPECVRVAKEKYPTVPVTGLRGALFALQQAGLTADWAGARR